MVDIHPMPRILDGFHRLVKPAVKWQRDDHCNQPVKVKPQGDRAETSNFGGAELTLLISAIMRSRSCVGLL
jgi:hypothetical protein